MARNRAPRNRGREEEEEEEMSKQNGEKGNSQNVGSPPIPEEAMGLVRELKDYSEQEIYEFLQECNTSYWEDEAMALVWALKDKWPEYPEEEIYQVLKECNMSYWEADKKLFRQDTRNRMLNEVHFYDDQLLEVKSEHEKEIQEAIDKKSSSSSSCGLGQGDSTPLCTTESELLSSEDHKEFLAASGSSVLEPPISSKPYSDLGSRLSHLQTERRVILKNHNEVFRSENSAASGPSVLEPPTTSKPCSDLGWQLSDLRVGQDAIVKDHNEDPVPISSVKTQASIIAESQENHYHKEFPAASGSSVLEPPISSKPYSDLGSRLSYLQIARGATVKNHNVVSRSENSAASIPSALGPTTTSKPCSDLCSQSSDLQVGRDAFVKDHNEVGDSCKSLPNNSSVSGVGATEALPNTNQQNLCLRPSASNLPESWTNLNAAHANSQPVYADTQEYDPWTLANQPVEIVLEVHLTRRAGVVIVLLGILLVLLRTMGVRASTDHYDSNSQYNSSRNFPSTSQGASFPARQPNDFQQSQQDLPQSEMESTQQQEQNPGRSLEDSNLRQYQMGASQGYQDQTTSSDTTCGDSEAQSHGQPRRP